MKIGELQGNADRAERLLKAMASRHRLMILCELHGGERSVAALNRAVGLSQSALSQHLAKLRDEGLVATRREAQTIHYRLASPEVARVIGLLYELYCPATEGTNPCPSTASSSPSPA